MRAEGFYSVGEKQPPGTASMHAVFCLASNHSVSTLYTLSTLSFQLFAAHIFYHLFISLILSLGFTSRFFAALLIRFVKSLLLHK